MAFDLKRQRTTQLILDVSNLAASADYLRRHCTGVRRYPQALVEGLLVQRILETSQRSTDVATPAGTYIQLVGPVGIVYVPPEHCPVDEDNRLPVSVAGFITLSDGRPAPELTVQLVTFMREPSAGGMSPNAEPPWCRAERNGSRPYCDRLINELMGFNREPGG